MKESVLSKNVEQMLDTIGRKYSNIQGSNFGKNNGDPDIITMDQNGRYLALELKVFGGECYPNQYDQLEHILKSGGRAFVLFPDVFIEHLTGEMELPKVTVKEGRKKTKQYSHELVLGGDDVG